MEERYLHIARAAALDPSTPQSLVCKQGENKLRVSLWMLISLYGSQVLEMGLFYSRILKASPLLVKEIKVQNLGEPGPVVTSFAKHPGYGHPFISDEKFNVTVNPRFHQRYGFWLNKGSSFTLIYNVKDSWEDSLVLAIVRGEDSYQEWTKDPSNAQLVSAWKRVYGRGSLNFTVTEDDDYYVAFGNLNAHEMKISFHLKMHCMIYSVQDAESHCSLVNGNVCRVPLSLSKSKRVLISAPDKKQHGVDVWKVKVSYIPRWITYFILWSVIGLGLLGMELRKQGRQVSTSQREVVPLTSIEGNESPENLARESQSADFSPALGSGNFQGGHGEQSLEQLCTVCLDAPKDSFFDPCGHRCTCYTCGMRIQNGDIARCPICRENVRAVHRIYDS
ncbi:unnamed protein product [Sphagnum compactum]